MENSRQLFDINTFKQCYEINRQKGFHQNPEYPMLRPRLLMLVISEAGEATESVRTGKYANRKAFEQSENDESFPVNFHKHIKDSFCDELADIALRLFDYAGACGLHYKGILREYEAEIKAWQGIEIKDVAAYLFDFTRCVTEIYYGAIAGDQVGEAIGKIHALAISKGIDLHWFIDMKMKYNQTRPYLNGKEF